MRFGLLLLFATFIQCSQAKLNNQSELGTDAYIETQGILCLTGQISACRAIAQIPECTTCRFFSTSTSYNGARGGISGADAICSNDAKKPAEPIGAIFKAFLVDDVNRIACTTMDCVTGGISEHKDWILKPNTSYVRAVDGESFATTNSNGIFSSQTAHAENPTVLNILTGIGTGGWLTRSGEHCNGWTNSSNVSPVGVATSSNSLFTSTGGTNCDTSSIIFCVEQ